MRSCSVFSSYLPVCLLLTILADLSIRQSKIPTQSEGLLILPAPSISGWSNPTMGHSDFAGEAFSLFAKWESGLAAANSVN
jgi:hypothetical protein